MSAPSISPPRHARIAVSVLFCTNGALIGSFLPRLPAVKAELDLSNTALGGGIAFFPEELNEVREVLDQISLDVRHRYTIGYVSSNPARNGVFRKIKVSAVDPQRRRPLETRARSGYLSAGDQTP